MKTSTLAIDGGTPVREKPWSPARGLGAFGEEEIEAALEVLRSRSLFRYYGPKLLHKTEAFEERLRELTGSRYSLGVSSGTAALQAALVGLRVEEGDEVVVPAITFIATVSAVVWARAVPVFADVDESLNMDPASFEANITDKTRVVIPVHLANVAADMDAINAVAKRHRVRVLEDAAQAAGVTYRGRSVGAIGDAGAFSLQLEKNITSGEGGALVTDDWDIHDRAARYHDQGGQFTTSKGDVRGETSGESFLGSNLRMTEIAGAIAEVQLRKLPAQIAAARERAWEVRIGLRDLGLQWRRMPDAEGEGGNVMFFVPSPDAAASFVKALLAEGIPAGRMYGGRPVYMNPAVLAQRTPWERGCPFNCPEHPTDRTYYAGLCPRAEDLLSRSVLVAVGPRMTDRDVADAVAGVRKVASHLLA